MAMTNDGTAKSPIQRVSWRRTWIVPAIMLIFGLSFISFVTDFALADAWFPIASMTKGQNSQTVSLLADDREFWL